jgi:hypothetical protein
MILIASLKAAREGRAHGGFLAATGCCQINCLHAAIAREEVRAERVAECNYNCFIATRPLERRAKKVADRRGSLLKSTFVK